MIFLPKPQALPAGILSVGLYVGYGISGTGILRILRLLGPVRDMVAVMFADADFSAYDAVIFSGGRGRHQAAGLGEPGIKNLRSYVKKGGGYLGICGGAYLACSSDWGLGLINAQTLSPDWRRGAGEVLIEVTEGGAEATDITPDFHEIHYANGPIVGPAGIKTLPKYTPLALYRSEIARHPVPMTNTPAWLFAPYGKGRVLISSPHPEQQAGMESFVESAVRCVARRDEQRTATAPP